MAWNYLAPLLNDMGVMTAADVPALMRLCETWAEVQHLQSVICTARSTTYEASTVTGGKMWRPRPEVAQLSDADRRLRAYLVEFGLTPSARSKVQMVTPTERDPAERFFDG